jgi:adenosylcobinamide-GDP ribazoletransferase
MVELSASLPYARKETGTGAPFVEGAGPRHKLTAWLIAVVLVAPVGSPVLLALVIGFITAKLLGRVYLRQLGGVTGDLLGAACEITETLLLFIGASLAERLKDVAGWERLI